MKKLQLSILVISLLYSVYAKSQNHYIDYFLGIFKREVAMTLDFSKKDADPYVNALYLLTEGDTLGSIESFESIEQNVGSYTEQVKNECAIAVGYLKMAQSSCLVNTIQELKSDIKIDTTGSLIQALHYFAIVEDLNYYNHFRRKLIRLKINNIPNSVSFIFDWFDVNMGYELLHKNDYPSGYSEFISCIDAWKNGDKFDAFKFIDSALIKSPKNILFINYKIYMNFEIGAYYSNIKLYKLWEEMVVNDDFGKGRFLISLSRNESLLNGGSYESVLKRKYFENKNLVLIDELIDWNIKKYDKTDALEYLKIRDEDYPTVIHKSDYLSAMVILGEEDISAKNKIHSFYKNNPDPYLAKKILECYKNQDSIDFYVLKFLEDFPENIEFRIERSRIYFLKGDEISAHKELVSVLEDECCNEKAFNLEYNRSIQYKDSPLFIEEMEANIANCYLGKGGQTTKNLIYDCYNLGKKDLLVDIISKNEAFMFSTTEQPVDAIANLIYLMEIEDYVKAEEYLDYFEGKFNEAFTDNIKEFSKIKDLLLICNEKYDELDVLHKDQKIDSDWIVVNEKGKEFPEYSKIMIQLGLGGEMDFSISLSEEAVERVYKYIK